jgi:hypothetical protein
VEASHDSKFVVVDVTTGGWEVDDCECCGDGVAVLTIEASEVPGGAMAPPGSRPLLCAIHSSGPTRREQSLLTPPVRIVIGRGVVGDSVLTTPVGFDSIDLGVVSVISRIGYLAVRARIVSLCWLHLKYHQQSHSRQQPRHCCQ